MPHEPLARRVALRRRRGQASKDDRIHEPLLAPETLEQARATLEELQTAEEELRQQNEELAAAREAIEAERKRYQELFDFAPDAYLVTDLQGMIREANAVAARLLGTDVRFLVGKPLTTFVADDVRRSFRAVVTNLSATDRIVDWDVRLKPRYGPAVDVAVATATIRQSDDTPIGLRWLLRDVTARRKVEEQTRTLNTELERRVALRTAELEASVQAKDGVLTREREARADLERVQARLALLAEASAVLASSLEYETTLRRVARLVVPSLADWCIVFVVGDDGAARPVAMSHVDGQKDLLLRETCDDQRLDSNSAAAVGTAAILRSGEPELVSRMTDTYLAMLVGNGEHLGAIRALGCTSTIGVPLTTRGRVVGALRFVVGDSGRRYDHRDLALATELARRVAVAVDNARLYREAQEAIQARDEFLSIAAHELRTPTTSLRGYAEVTLRRLRKDRALDPGHIDRALEVIALQSAKLSRLVVQLLNLSRLRAGRLTLERAQVDVATVVEAAVEAAEISAAGYAFQLKTSPALALVDAIRIEQVITNLLDNAVKYSPAGSAIQVEVEPASEAVSIVVADRGAGIPPEYREDLFNRFFRAHRNDHSSGMGLGLYISRQIVDLHGGTIDAEFPPEGGSRFTVRLPRGLPVPSTEQMDLVVNQS